MVNKAVPIVLRRVGDQTEILVFDHPLAGRQLVKGTLEAGESIKVAAVRELWEESGLNRVRETIFLGIQEYAEIGQRWHFVRCILDHELPEKWEHFTEDGGGLVFKFCWQPLNQPIHNLDGPIFEQARQWILTAV